MDIMLLSMAREVKGLDSNVEVFLHVARVRDHGFAVRVGGPGFFVDVQGALWSQETEESWDLVQLVRLWITCNVTSYCNEF